MKSKFNGWDKVFRFTLIQTLKGKSFLVSTIIFAIICFALIPYMAKSKNGGNISESILEVNIEKIYICDAIGMGNESLKESLVDISESYEKTEIESFGNLEKQSKDEIKEEFSELGDCDDAVLIFLMQEEGYYDIEVIRSKNTNVRDMEVSIFDEDIYNTVQSSLYEIAGIDEEQVKFLKSENEITNKKITDGKVENEKKSNSNEQSDFSNSMAAIMLLLFLLAIGGEAASTSMITEKASRAIEFVLTSVKPMALILGKVLASIVAEFIQIAIIIFSIGSSTYLFTHGNTKLTTTKQIAQSMGLDMLVTHLKPAEVAVAILIVLGGIVFYITIACLVGSTASKMEELAHTNMIYSMTLIVGMYISMILIMKSSIGESPLELFVFIFPLSAPFSTPFYMLMGKCSLKIGIISLLCLMLAIILLVCFVAKVFEAVIMFNGSKVTIGKMLEFAGLKKSTEQVKGGSANE